MYDHDDPVRLYEPGPGIFTIVLDWPAAAMLGPDPAALRIHAGPGARAAAEVQRDRLRARLAAISEGGR